MVGPFTPEEAENAHLLQLPEEVFETVNKFLATRSGDRSITVYQDEVVKELETRGFSRKQIDEERLLSFKHAYSQVGWTVTYERPAYNETGRAFWVFNKR